MEIQGLTNRGIFWGWYVVIGAFIITGINYGARYCFGVFLKPMCDDLGWSRSVVSTAISLAILTYGIGSIFSGQLLDRFAPRWIITAGAVIASLGFVITRFASTPLQMYISYGVIYGLGASCLGGAVCTSSVGKWFIQKRGIALGITTTGIGVGTMILTPLAGIIVKYCDWQTGFTVLGITIFFISVAASQFFMGRSHPERYGLLPDGAASSSVNPESPEINFKRRNSSHGQTLNILLRNSRFWIIVTCFGISYMAEMTVFVHQVAYAEEQGIDRVTAASSLGIVGIASIVGRFFFGWLSDHLSDPYNTPRKLDRVIRCMIACHRMKGAQRWTGTCEGATTQPSRPG